LESVCSSNVTEGSNPSLSAILRFRSGSYERHAIEVVSWKRRMPFVALAE